MDGQPKDLFPTKRLIFYKNDKICTQQGKGDKLIKN
jgi:hypothetical protein